MRHQLKLYGTFGPSCHTVDTLVDMLRAGMTGIRLNLSHSDLKSCHEWMMNLHKASEVTHIVPDLLCDLGGRELRVGRINKPITLKEQADVILYRVGAGDSTSTHPSIPIPEILIDRLVDNDAWPVILKLDDGKLTLQVTEAKRTDDEETILLAKVMVGGTLSSRKSIACEQLDLNLPPVSQEDLENMGYFGTYGVSGIMVPFTQYPKDLIEIKSILAQRGLVHIKIFAKIENETGLENLPSLIPHCDEIIIARGDLGNNLPMKKVPLAQKKIAALCQRTKTPFMVVTQMLASMEESSTPTRAEVSDIFNAVLDGASSLMLTGETAAGKHPLEAMKVLSEVSFEAQRYQIDRQFF